MDSKLFLSVGLTLVTACSFAQTKDKSEFKKPEPGYFQNVILKDVNSVNDSLKKPETSIRFLMVQDTTDIPRKFVNYKTLWHNPTISQGNTGTCWCFSTTSFFESEIKRIYNKEVRLSEMYTVYCEYIEKARRFVRELGESAFSEGSEADAVTRIYNMYGVMPLNVYTGLTEGRKFYTHEAMFNEMDSFLKSVKAMHSWNEDWVIRTIKEIMNKYMGVPPASFKADGKDYTPHTYLKDYLKLNPDDYIDILSCKQEPFWQKVEYKVPDNWWHSKDYYNVPLDVFMEIIKKSITNGFTMAIGGDISEPGFSKTTQAAQIPDWDIPSAYIGDDARQFRFSNGTTTDDHGMHLIGYCQKDGKYWFLIKDSGSGSRNNDQLAPEFGYYFFHEDYVKLKMMDFMICKDAVKDILQKFK